jgi:hypothetical protein
VNSKAKKPAEWSLAGFKLGNFHYRKFWWQWLALPPRFSCFTPASCVKSALNQNLDRN